MSLKTKYEHGTFLRYYSARCRCGACREAGTAYARERRESYRAQRRAADEIGVQFRPSGLTHGSVATYNVGCRCEECRAAKAANRLRYYRPRVS